MEHERNSYILITSQKTNLPQRLSKLPSLALRLLTFSPSEGGSKVFPPVRNPLSGGGRFVSRHGWACVVRKRAEEWLAHMRTSHLTLQNFVERHEFSIENA